ncbi:MAG: hypothetical protein J6333_09595 [Planctomycetes bacterium]|nr:hypothetical protein [Planctomycetota bacterium]
MEERQEEIRVAAEGQGKILFIPNMEPYCVRLMAAVFKTLNYHPHVLLEDDKSLAMGFKHTAWGECIPCPCTTGALMKAMEEMHVPPERVILFMPTACGPCRFGQYVKLNQIIFEKKGWNVQIMSPTAENAYGGMPADARVRLWNALLLGDVCRKLACKVRPYEVNPGETDALVEKHMARMEEVFGSSTDITPTQGILGDLVRDLQAVKKRDVKKPLVGIVGEIFVRSDPYINGNLIRRIEALGGEAWLAPFSEWIFYTMKVPEMLTEQNGSVVSRLLSRAKSWLANNLVFHKAEETCYGIADPLLHDRREYPIDEVIAAGMKYTPWQFEGEAILTLGRARLFFARDNAKAVVNASPMFCMPGTITSSIFPQVEKEFGHPVINNFYDGSGDPNKSLAPVMHYLCENCAKERAAAV